MPKTTRKSESELVKEVKKGKKDITSPTLTVKPKEICKVNYHLVHAKNIYKSIMTD